MVRGGKTGRWAGLAAVMLSGLVAAACTLPYQQLNLPDAASGPTGSSASAKDRKGGVALSSAPAPSSREARSYPGSGEMVGQTQEASGGEAPDGAAARRTGSGQVSVRPAESGDKDAITLSIAGATVPEIARTVLGDVLGVNYSVSDKVKAVISLHTSQPVAKNDLLAIFESVLRAEGIAIVVENGLYRILPATDVAGGGAPLRVQKRPGAAGVTTSIVPLRFVAAAEMERILKSAAPQASILRVDGARNLLMISGTQSEQASLRDMVSMFDVDWMRGMSFAILPVETSDPEAIAQELDTVFATNQDGPTKGMVRFVPNRRLKSVLVITSRPEYLKKAETWLKRIDMASRATEKQVYIYRAQHRPAAELAPVLQKVYQAQAGAALLSSQSSIRSQTATTGIPDPLLSGSTSSMPGGIGLPVGGPQPFGSAGFAGTPTGAFAGRTSPLPAATTTRVGETAVTTARVGEAPIAPAQPEGLVTGSLDAGKSAAGGGLPPDDRIAGIAIVADESRNSLVITATPSEYRRVRELLARIDVSGAQILLEATIAEVGLSDNLKFGVRWFLNKGGNNPTFNSPLGSGQTQLPSLPLPVPTAAAGFQYIMSMANLQVVLNALSAVTDVNVVSSPSLMVQENKKAYLQIGDQVPILTQEVQSNVANAPIVNSVTLRDTGVILGITPWLADDGKVMLDIEQEVSDAVATTTSTINSPTIQQRRVKTSVSVHDGDTIILAGFMQDRATRNRDQIPLIGNVPLIGNAFKSKDDSIKRTELLISITPQVVRDGKALEDITSEYRDRLNLSTRPQRVAPPDRRENVDRIVR